MTKRPPPIEVSIKVMFGKRGITVRCNGALEGRFEKLREAIVVATAILEEETRDQYPASDLLD